MIVIAFRYSVFALISIATNLFVQYLSFLIYQGNYDIYLALLLGTLAGLVVKYVLDKKYIFFHQTHSHKENGVAFMLYSLMGVFTTIIFWGFELGFDAVFSSDQAKYLGGFLGLLLGYIIKYFLDKKFVFRGNA